MGANVYKRQGEERITFVDRRPIVTEQRLDTCKYFDKVPKYKDSALMQIHILLQFVLTDESPS